MNVYSLLLRGKAMRWQAAAGLAAMIVLGPAAARAQEAPACAATDTALPAELGGWTAKSDLVSATSAADLSKAALSVGKGVEAQLHPTRTVTYVTQPEKPGGSVSHGGMFDLNIDQAGTYRIALGAGSWIDVLKDGKPLESVGHGMGPKCSTVRKMVDFALQPGHYVVQISANADEKLAIMALRRP